GGGHAREGDGLGDGDGVHRRRGRRRGAPRAGRRCLGRGRGRGGAGEVGLALLAEQGPVFVIVVAEGTTGHRGAPDLVRKQRVPRFLPPPAPAARGRLLSLRLPGAGPQDMGVSSSSRAMSSMASWVFLVTRPPAFSSWRTCLASMVFLAARGPMTS